MVVKAVVLKGSPRSASFAGFQSSSATATALMKRNTREGGRAEWLLRKQLRAHGVRFRTHPPAMPGRPDVVVSSARLCVFCDGDFWHGRNWRVLRRDLARRANARYWMLKIETNRARDRRQSRELRASGWVVLRLWETDILRNPAAATQRVLRFIAASRHQDLRPG